MSAVVLANVDYQRHMTTEGNEFQEGLRAAGWTLSGVGYDGLVDVPTILARYQPTRVVVHDPRDWDPASPIAFRKDLGFRRLLALQTAAVFTAVVVKDAASTLDYQRACFDAAGGDAAIVYYHPTSVTRHAPWLQGVPLIRIYHSVDRAALADVSLRRPRQPAVVSGAASTVYPLRQRIIRDAALLGVDVLPHPGYGNRGPATPQYLRTLAGYQVSIATASQYGFALRKIIEGVACGCTVITDLPAYDVLPEINAALVRVSPTITTRELQRVVREATANWVLEERRYWAQRAQDFYDHIAIGARLDQALTAAAATREVPA
jgi:hypothetical protein